MGIWDEQDYFGRWIQLICGIVLLGIAAALAYTEYEMSAYRGWFAISGCCGSAYLSLRCLQYAITGRGNVNRDDFD